MEQNWLIILYNDYFEIMLQIMNYQYKHVTIAGTFDRLHEGHKHLIEKAFVVSQNVSIGLATHSLTKNKNFSSSILLFDQRKKELVEYLTQRRYIDRSKIFDLNDIYGISKYDESLEAVLVTSGTYSNAVKINMYRKNHKLPTLQIIKIPFIKGNDKKIISSTRIRKGEINRSGDNYSHLFSKPILKMPESIRMDLQKPIGILIEGTENDIENVTKRAVDYLQKMKPIKIITVGDIVSRSLRTNGLDPDIQIVDFKTRRNIEVNNDYLKQIKNKYINKPGTIHKKIAGRLFSTIKKIILDKTKHHIIIKGEEDLLALPAILFAPLDSVVIYGLFDKGLVIVEVTEQKKEQIIKIIDLFD